MSIASQLAAYKVTVNADVTTQTTAQSIEPPAVGFIGTELADIILDPLESINNYAITQGTSIPNDLDGADLDQYTRINGGVLTLYKKIAGSWVSQITYSFGYILPDGPLTLRTTISGSVVTVTLGGWIISNVIYQKLTQTQFTLTAADLNFTRYDLIYATTSNTILKLDGTASSSPAFPSVPANCIAVDYAIVPASSSGNSPYLLYGGGTSSIIKSSLSFTEGDLVVDGEFIYLQIIGLAGLWPYAIKVKNMDTGHTTTNYLLEADDTWPVPRYSGFANNTDDLEITILII